MEFYVPTFSFPSTLLYPLAAIDRSLLLHFMSNFSPLKARHLNSLGLKEKESQGPLSTCFSLITKGSHTFGPKLKHSFTVRLRFGTILR